MSKANDRSLSRPTRKSHEKREIEHIPIQKEPIYSATMRTMDRACVAIYKKKRSARFKRMRLTSVFHLLGKPRVNYRTLIHP